MVVYLIFKSTGHVYTSNAKPSGRFPNEKSGFSSLRRAGFTKDDVIKTDKVKAIPLAREQANIPTPPIQDESNNFLARMRAINALTAAEEDITEEKIQDIINPEPADLDDFEEDDLDEDDGGGFIDEPPVQQILHVYGDFSGTYITNNGGTRDYDNRIDGYFEFEEGDNINEKIEALINGLGMPWTADEFDYEIVDINNMEGDEPLNHGIWINNINGSITDVDF